MSNKQIEMKKIKKIFKLYSQGESKRSIAKQVGISRNTVDKYVSFFNRYKLTYEEVMKLSNEELHRLFLAREKEKPEKLKTLERYFPYFDKELKKTGVTQELLWREYKQKHPDGYMLSQFGYWYGEWRRVISPVMHFNYKAGDKLFVDFTGKKLPIVDLSTGEVKELEVLVCVLGSSHYTYVEACDSQKKEDFIRAIENALWFFEGVPRALVTDNLKSAVIKSSRYEPTLNETFADFADHYEIAVLPTRAYKPRDKAIVESAVRIIYTRVFAPLRNTTFHSKLTLNKAILPLLQEHNNQSFRGREYSRRSLFEEVEKSSLLPLPTKRFELKLFAKGTVYKNSHIYLGKDKHYYSVPYKYIGKRVRIIYSDSLVEIYIKHQRIATHPRSKKRYQYTTDKEHMPSYHKFVAEWSSEKFISWASNIGEDCKQYIIGVLNKKQHPEQSYKSCLGILHLTKKVGSQRLNDACKRAQGYHTYSYKIREKILRNGWDKVQDADGQDIQVPDHQNIRGKNYFK
jgi:transposase